MLERDDVGSAIILWRRLTMRALIPALCFLSILTGANVMAHAEEKSNEPVSRALDNQPFRVLDGTLFRNKPKGLEHLGFENVSVGYETSFEWPSGKRDMPSRASVEKFMHEVAKRGGTRADMDFESEGYWYGAWFARDDASRKNTAEKLITIAKWAKASEPNISLAFYNYTPQQAPYASTDPKTLPAWRKVNLQFFQSVADATDRMAPQLYTFNNDEKWWMADAEQVIKLAKEMGKGTKPVTPYVWFRMHGGADKNNWYKPVPLDFFKRQLEKIHAEGADGVLIWDGDYQGNWDENADWWRVTKEFLATKPQVIRTTNAR
jgi:hypothetical protein